MYAFVSAEFRYEGIILVKKNSNINSLKELRGKKSCHTGFGRNVGYKVSYLHIIIWYSFYFMVGKVSESELNV